MLIFPVLRLVMLLLLLAVLVDGATEQDYRNNWEFLFWAETPDLPSGFFDLLRVVLFISVAWDAWTHTRYASLGFVGSKGWTVVLALLLLLYQPIFPVRFDYHWWLWIDLTAFCVLAVHTWIVSRPLFELLSSAVSRGENLLTVPLDLVTAAVFLGYTNAASLMAKAAEGLQEEQKKPAKGPEDKGPREVNPAFVQPPPAAVQPKPPPRPSSDPLYATSNSRTLSEQIVEAEKLVRKIQAVLATSNLPLERQLELERSLQAAQCELDRQLALELSIQRANTLFADKKAQKQAIPSPTKLAPHTAKPTESLPDEQEKPTKSPKEKYPRESKPARSGDSEPGTAEITETEVVILKAKRTQMVEALKRTTKMKRAPAGARSSRLKEG